MYVSVEIVYHTLSELICHTPSENFCLYHFRLKCVTIVKTTYCCALRTRSALLRCVSIYDLLNDINL